MSGNYDRLVFAPYFIFKDIITIFIFMWVLALFVFFVPNVLGDSENYVMANPMQTPPAIVPEWYLLPFYAILRSIPNKLIGVIAMFSAIIIILALTISDIAKLRGIQFKPLSKTVFFVFVGNLLLLMVLGAKHVESPFIEFGQIATLLYFVYYSATMPVNNFIELTLGNLYVNLKDKLDKFSSVLQSNVAKPSVSHAFLIRYIFSSAPVGSTPDSLSIDNPVYLAAVDKDQLSSMAQLTVYFQRVFDADSPVKAIKAYGKVQKFIGQDTDLDEYYGPRALHLVDRTCRARITELMKAQGVESDSSGYDTNDATGEV